MSIPYVLVVFTEGGIRNQQSIVDIGDIGTETGLCDDYVLHTYFRFSRRNDPSRSESGFWTQGSLRFGIWRF